MIICSIINFLLILLTAFFIVRDRRHNAKTGFFPINPKDIKTAILIVLLVLFIYNTLGYILNSDIISVFSYENHSFGISFIGIALWIVTSLAIGFIISIVNRKIQNKIE